MEWASDSPKRAHTEVSSDGHTVDSGSYKSKISVRKQKGSAKLRLPLRWLPIPWPRGLQVSFPVCLRASSLPLQSVVALLSVHEGPFSSTNGLVVNFN